MFVCVCAHASLEDDVNIPDCQRGPAPCWPHVVTAVLWVGSAHPVFLSASSAQQPVRLMSAQSWDLFIGVCCGKPHHGPTHFADRYGVSVAAHVDVEKLILNWKYIPKAGLTVPA